MTCGKIGLMQNKGRSFVIEKLGFAGSTIRSKSMRPGGLKSLYELVFKKGTQEERR